MLGGGLGRVFLLDAAERGEVDGLVEVDDCNATLWTFRSEKHL